MYIDEKSVIKTTKALQKLSRSAVPLAIRGTLNDLAFQSRQAMQQQIKKDFINRNKYTERSIRVNKVSQYDIENMKSETGSTAKYMETQYKGGRIKAKYKNKPIPMKNARVSSSDSKLVRRPYRMKNLDLGGRVFYSKKTRRPGIFISTGKRKRKKIKKLWDLSNSSVNIKRKDWLSPAVDRYANQRNFNRIYTKNALRQIKRLTG